VEGWLAREPKLAEAYALDGWRLRQDGQLEEAEGRLQQALHLDPHNVRALVELGRLFEHTEFPERALVLYEWALRVSPKDEEIAERVNLLRRKGVGKPKPG
jgi:tetratricopeptide (TPR) repeat protein